MRDRVVNLRGTFGIPVDPKRRGPVLLAPFFEELNLRSITLPELTCGRVTDFLQAQGMAIEPVGEPNRSLAGCLFWAGDDGWAFVNGDGVLARRRFSAAHELGHAVLHRETMGGFIDDVDVNETDEAETLREREANQFAAELLMPVEIVEARAAELRAEHRACPRLVLAYRLASELLVSGDAMRYRLKNLGIGDD